MKHLSALIPLLFPLVDVEINHYGARHGVKRVHQQAIFKRIPDGEWYGHEPLHQEHPEMNTPYRSHLGWVKVRDVKVTRTADNPINAYERERAEDIARGIPRPRPKLRR